MKKEVILNKGSYCQEDLLPYPNYKYVYLNKTGKVVIVLENEEKKENSITNYLS